MYEIDFKACGDGLGEIVVRVSENSKRLFVGSYNAMSPIADELARAYEAGVEDGKAQMETDR